MSKQKVFVIGAGGMVGSAAAYAMALQNVAEEIVLIDRDPNGSVWGHAADINDGLGFGSGVEVRVGSYDDIATGDIVVITAGAPQQPGQTRLELLGVNAEIIRGIVRDIMKHDAEPYLLLVSNPVDVLTYVALKESGLPKTKVFGTGTTLDTSRLKSYLADALDVNSREVDAYILGEHGDSSFSTIEVAQVGEVPLKEYPGFRPELITNVEQTIRERAYKVIDTKKATYYAIGNIIAQVVMALSRSTHSVFPVCSLVEGEYGLHDVVLGLPSIVNSDGVRILAGYPLTTREQEALNHSAAVVQEAIRSVLQ